MTYNYNEKIAINDIDKYIGIPIALCVNIENELEELWVGRVYLEKINDTTRYILKELMPFIINGFEYDPKRLIYIKWDRTMVGKIKLDRNTTNTMRTLTKDEFNTYKKYILAKKFIFQQKPFTPFSKQYVVSR